jgi:hypothetical protein
MVGRQKGLTALLHSAPGDLDLANDRLIIWLLPLASILRLTCAMATGGFDLSGADLWVQLYRRTLPAHGLIMPYRRRHFDLQYMIQHYCEKLRIMRNF